ncbi:FHA domain-containing protein [Streptomyces sp. NPDC001450]
MAEAHDLDDDEDPWETVTTSTPTPPRTSRPPVGTQCERCDAIVPAGMARCPGCLYPVGARERDAGTRRLAGGVVRLVFRGGGRHLDVPRGSEIRLGRSGSWAPAASGLLADEETVSAQHATLVHTSGGAAWLTEVPWGATNGTRVNDRILVPGSRIRLRNGDRVELGPRADFVVQGIEDDPGEEAS